LLCSRLSITWDAFPLALHALPIRDGGLGLTSLTLTQYAAAAGALISTLSADAPVPPSIQRSMWTMLRATERDPALRETAPCCFFGRALCSLGRVGVTPTADDSHFAREDKVLPSKHAQRALAELFVRRQWNDIIAAGDSVVQRVVRSTTGSSSAGAWLTAFPSDCFRIDDHAFRHAVLSRLAVAQTSELVDMFGQHCPMCAQPTAEGHDCGDPAPQRRDSSAVSAVHADEAAGEDGGVPAQREVQPPA